MSTLSTPATDKRARLKEWLSSGAAALHPLSLPQRELWEAAPVPVDDCSNHICCLIEVQGLMTEPTSRNSLQLVVDRQEALRTSILPGKERPLQLIRKQMDANITFRDLTAAEKTPEGVEAVAREISLEPFEMLGGPLYRAVLLRRAADEHVIVLGIHHAIADGWTLGVLIQDLFGAYLQTLMGLRDPLPAVPQSYTAWSASERAWWTPERVAERADFWQKELAGRPRLWTTPENPGPVRGPAERWVSSIDAKLAAAAQELGRRHGATLYNTLLTAFQVALGKWAGTDDVVVGSPSANRSKQSTHETMGYFAGIVPIRGHVDGARPFGEALRSVQESTVNAFSHALPFAELAALLGERPAPGYNPIFEVRFALQNHPMPDVKMPNISARLHMRSTGTPRYVLACEVTEQKEGLEVVWLHRHPQFSRKDVEELDQLFKLVLTKACASPERRTAELTA